MPRHCTQCGGPISDGAQFCRHCGAPVGQPAASATPAQERGRAPSAQRIAGLAQDSVPSDNRADVGDAGALSAAALKGLPKADALRRIARTVVKAGAKSLGLSALVLGPGFLLLFSGHLYPGMAWLFVGSFGLVAWTYRKPWRLGLVSCLIPPVVATFCYAAQLWLFGNAMPPAPMLLVAIGAGVALGWARGRAHEVYLQDGSVFAARTVLYLGIWAAAYGLTQAFGLLAAHVWLVRGGLLSGALTTAMLAVASMMLFSRWKSLRTGSP